MSRRPLHFIGPQPSRETVETLRGMLAQAESGELLGLNYSAILKSRAWTYGSTGEAARSAPFAIGVLIVQVIDMAVSLLKEHKL